MLSWANILAFADSLGVQYDRLNVALGAATESGSVRKAANLNLGRIMTATGTEAQVGADMLGDSITHLANVTAESTKAAELLKGDVDNLYSHVRDRGAAVNSLDLQAEANNARFSPSFAKLLRACSKTLEALNVFPAVTTLATFAVTGDGAGTYTDGAEIDTALYGGGDLEAVAVGAIGGANIVITAAILKEGSVAGTATGTLTAGSPDGTAVNLTIAASAKAIDVTGITITGGTNGDDFIIRTKLDRTPAE